MRQIIRLERRIDMTIVIKNGIAYIIFKGEVIRKCSPEIAEITVINLIIAMGL